MKRRHVVIAKGYDDNNFFMRVARKNEEELNRKRMAFYKSFAEIVIPIIEKETGHRYLLDIRGADNNSKAEANIKLCCKRIAIFVKKKLEEYDDTLKINIIKLY